MASITLKPLLEQTRELASDSEGRLYGDLDASMADAIKHLPEGIDLYPLFRIFSYAVFAIVLAAN